MGVRSAYRNAFNDLGGMSQVAAFGIEAGQVEHHLLRLRLNGLGDLEFLLGLLGIVLDGVELAQDHAVLDALGLKATIFSNSAMAWSRTLPEGEVEETELEASLRRRR